MQSIIQNNKKCFVCSKTIGLHNHHVFFGTAKRKISEQNGFKVWLCYDHHEGTFGVHGKNGHQLDLYLKRICQLKYEESHTRDDFIKLIGKNYIKE